ncbi:unnamed protein product [Candida verbasci]|uniref:Ceramide glucosyltransferase n=1 Tax=Candida verbasci TaxID=1227364 RepID=A0A9W4XBL4_9ASCO|nr:unnamed protein product [Candida verbasci]
MDKEVSIIRLIIGWVCLIWYLVILIVAYSGFVEILIKFRKRSIIKSKQVVKDDNLEGVTILRPIKGIDPELKSCLESSFCQNYPRDKIQILFCIEDPNDLSIPIIESLINKYPTIDSKILIGGEHYGPNPKVNNLSKGILQAKYDILWIMDSNVWASSNILKNSIITLNENLNNGRDLSNKRPVKLVHHVPLALSIEYNEELQDLENNLTPIQSNESRIKLTNRKNRNPSNKHKECDIKQQPFLKKIGSKLDEMFLHTSHSKFYVSLNNLAIAPCVNGKSNLYRKSELDKSVKEIPTNSKSEFFTDLKVKNDAKYYSNLGVGNSMKFFSRYIGEDNMIGIALWENCNGRTGLTGDCVIQPLSGLDNNTLKDYINRRVRWLRVRKYMVLLATLIEPTTESIICGLYGNIGISILFLHKLFTIKLFVFHMILWVITDFIQYNVLINHTIDEDNMIFLPIWLKSVNQVNSGTRLLRWLIIWIIREILALPIWLIAMFGHKIDWRGTPFKIKKDLTAEEL